MTDHRQAIKEHICDQLAEGINLREICRQDGMPTWRAVYYWMDNDEEFASAIARARELGYHAIAAESMAIADEEPERIVSEQVSKVDPGYVAWQKLRVEHRLKLLAKWSPKLYGDRVDHVSSDGSMSQKPTVIELVAKQKEE